MDSTVRTLLYYALSILAGALAAGLAVLATQLGGTDPINWRPVLAAALGPLVAGLLSTRLPRPEGAELADRIDTLKAQGVDRRDMTVVRDPEASRR